MNISTETSEAIRALMARRGISATETIRRAIDVYKYIEDEIRDGRTVLVTSPSGKQREVVLL